MIKSNFVTHLVALNANAMLRIAIMIMLRSCIYPYLTSYAIHFRLESSDIAIISVFMAAIAFIVIYLLVLLCSKLNEKNKTERINVFDTTMNILLINGAVSIIVIVVTYLFEIEDLMILGIFSIPIFIGTAPLLLVWLLAKAFEYLRSKRELQKKNK